MRSNEPDLLGRPLILVAPIPFTLRHSPRFGPVDGIFLGSAYERTIDDKAAAAGVGWSHTFGYRNVLNAAVFATGFKRDGDETSLIVFDTALLGPLAGRQTFESRTEQQYLSGSGEPRLWHRRSDLQIRSRSRHLDFQTSTLSTSTHRATPSLSRWIATSDSSRCRA